MAFGLDDALIAGTIGVATGATTGAFNLFGGSQQNAATKELAKLQQYYAVQNAYLAHQFEQENLATQGCQAKSLQASAYQFDRQLAKYNRKLSKLSADEDYARSLNYIADAQAAYKAALLKNGYNPLLALGSSIPSYSGHTNAASGSVGSASAGSAATSAAPKAGPGGQGANLQLGSAVSSGITSALDFARLSSEIKENESQIEKNKADAVKSLQDAARSADLLEADKSKTQSSTAKDYGDLARDVAMPIVTYEAGKRMAKKGESLKNEIVGAIKSGNQEKVKDLLPAYSQPVMKESNSAYLGSRSLQAIMPWLFALPAAVGSGAAVGYGEKYIRDFETANPEMKGGYHDLKRTSAIMGL